MKKHSLRLFIVLILGAFLIQACSAMLPYKDDFQCQRGKNSGVCGSVSEVYDLSSNMDDLRIRTLDGSKNQDTKNKAKQLEEEMQRQKDIFVKQKLQEMVEATEIRNIQNEHPVIFRFYLDEDKRVPTSAPLVWNNDHSATNSVKVNGVNNGKKSKSQKTTQTNRAKTKANNIDKNSTKEVKVTQQEKPLEKKWALLNEENNQSVNKLFKSVEDMNTSKSVPFKDTNTSSSVNEVLIKNPEFSDNKDNKELCSSSGGVRKEINAEVKVCVYMANIRQEPSCKSKVLRIANKDEVLFALYEQDGWVKLNDGTFIHKSIITQD